MSFLRKFFMPYIQLARWDKPIGIWLLFWPCVWGIGLAPVHTTTLSSLPEDDKKLIAIALFFIGAIAMRGAGCIINDLTDRDLDKQVARTASRPLASGALHPFQAFLFLGLHLIVALFVLLCLPRVAQLTALATLPFVIAYPWMKRLTWWPQAFLGLVFNSGVLVGWADIAKNLDSPVPFLLYAGGIAWTIAYDTVYAHQDIDDDALAGIKSTARLWGPDSKKWVGLFWIIALILWAVSFKLAVVPFSAWVMLFLAGLLVLTAHSFWKPDNKAFSLAFFRLQHWVGMLVALACLARVLL